MAPAFLLVTALIMLTCVLLNRLSGKLGVPVLLAFLLLGMLFGADSLIPLSFQNDAFTENICSTALIFIMFYGGFGTKWSEARPVAGQAVMMSTLGVLLTGGFVGLFCRLVFRLGWLESFLLGSVIGSTDAASVFSILRSRKLALKENTSSLLEVESGSNDPCSYMLTVLFLSVMNGEASGWKIVYMIFAQVVYGLAFGIVIALAARWVFCRYRFSAEGYQAACYIAVALLAYAAPATIGGNGYLATYLVGLVLGNSDIRNKRQLVPFFDGITGMAQIMIFFLLGLFCVPAQLLKTRLLSLGVFLFVTFAARPLATALLLSPFGCRLRKQTVVSWAGFRGAASIVFAVMAQRQAETSFDLFSVVFGVVLYSILLQGTLLPFVARKLDMIDKSGDVMKTFSDYSHQIPVKFVEVTVREGHPWCGREVKEITLPPDTLIALLQREGTSLVPKGKTVLQADDVLILSARSSRKIEGVSLSERTIFPESAEVGKPIGALELPKNDLVVLIMRGNDVIIPNGSTVVAGNDILVINSL